MAYDYEEKLADFGTVTYLPISRICLQYLEVVGTVGVFKNYQAQPYNHYGFKAKDGIGAAPVNFEI